MLVRHAMAFFLYLIAVIIFYGLHSLETYVPNNFTKNMYEGGMSLGALASLIAQISLISILWDLGTKVETKVLQAQQEELYSNEDQEEYDEEEEEEEENGALDT